MAAGWAVVLVVLVVRAESFKEAPGQAPLVYLGLVCLASAILAYFPILLFMLFLEAF